MATTTPQDASIRRQQSGIWAVFLFSARRRVWREEEKMMFVRAERPRTEGWNAVQWSVSVLKGAQQWWWTCVMKWTVSLSSPTPFALPHSPHTRPGQGNWILVLTAKECWILESVWGPSQWEDCQSETLEEEKTSSTSGVREASVTLQKNNCFSIVAPLGLNDFKQ